MAAIETRPKRSMAETEAVHRVFAFHLVVPVIVSDVHNVLPAFLPAIPAIPAAPAAPAAPAMDQPGTSKRGALTISTGAPRPLHLPSRSLSDSPGPQTAPLPLPSTSSSPTSYSHSLADPPLTGVPRTASRRPENRRQSSISYFPSDSPRSWSPRIPPPNNAYKRASVALGAITPNRDAKEVRRRSMFAGVGDGGGKTEANVLTLAEKHAPLLQFIAQKESKCLELRSQLAVHESELLALKQAWERIVRRDFGKTFNVAASAPSASPPAPLPSTPPTSRHAPSASGLDSLLENMPSLGRILALAPPAAEPSPSPRTHSSAQRPSPFAKRQAHASSPSASTTASSATTTNSSVRFSQSSASSLEEEPDAKHASEETLVGQKKPVEELIVRDTGATPTFSPNPAFLSSSKDTAASARGLRRRSRDAASLVPVPAPVEVEDDSHHRRPSTLPPPASVPGIGSLAAMGVNMDISAAQGWMDSVGKRWSESGRTFTKSQKRASVLISDVSQSLFAALSPTSSPAPCSPAPSSTWLSPGPGSRATPSPSPSRKSLLDEDDDMPGLGLSGVMLPDSSASPRTPAPLKPQPKPKAMPTPKGTPRSPAPINTSAANVAAPAQDDDDDDDWNW
ncbi:hypothetical protein OF83DRAFT_1156451 [Amylostereum chailletii]|nr:hypothetical protein OF83DRAFT_1156451 [Amylostereum chailletii]